MIGTGFAQQSHFEIQGGIQSTLWTTFFFFCLSITSSRLNFCPLTKWNCLLSHHEISSARGRADMLNSCSLKSLNKFEHYLTIQIAECFDVEVEESLKCSGREAFQL